MILSLTIAFIIGLGVGLFLGVMGVSLCLMGRRSDTPIESEI